MQFTKLIPVAAFGLALVLSGTAWAQGQGGGGGGGEGTPAATDLECEECVELEELESNSVDSSKIIDGTVSETDLAFPTATQGELDDHAGLPNVHHVPTVDTQLNAAGIEALVGAHTTDTTLTDAEVRAIVGEHLEILECDPGDLARLDPGGSGIWKCLSLLELVALLPGPKSVFVTSNGYTGNLISEAILIDPGFSGNGLEAGDFICNTLASDAGLPGEYVAWLSDNTTNAKDRLTPGSGPFVRIDFEKVADDIVNLTDGAIDVPIAVDEGGVLIDVILRVWTGTFKTGLAHFAHCVGWTTGMESTDGRAGLLNSSTAVWTQHSFVICDTSLPIYCFQK